MTPATLRYLHLTVFTANLLEGNQLVVFPPPRHSGGPDATDRREMAFLGVHVHLCSVGDRRRRMRIFTPGE